MDGEAERVVDLVLVLAAEIEGLCGFDHGDGFEQMWVDLGQGLE